MLLKRFLIVCGLVCCSSELKHFLKMRKHQPYDESRKAAVARYNAKFPRRSTENRHKRIEVQGKVVHRIGRPYKKAPNWLTVHQQNLKMIKEADLDFELEDDEANGKRFILRKSRIHGLGVFVAVNNIKKDEAVDGVYRRPHQSK